jgi:hypothetical protein
MTPRECPAVAMMELDQRGMTRKATRKPKKKSRKEEVEEGNHGGAGGRETPPQLVEL